MHGGATHPDLRRQRPNRGLAPLPAEIAHGRLRILWDHPWVWVTWAVPRIDRMWWGGSLVSIVIATRSPVLSALSLGAPGRVPITMSVPSQWNQMDTTRGVPSVQL